ncbi:polysaccharide ABC transporter ATP-binding protein [Frondihabitans sucicola]|uniref:Polysaccharide ABC transporter ATP-binding protein n=1 Tax=Frondihabitans sucicola TaxID=1268041 RepID=A0ABM8GJE5_9MICO|nr:ABC transporter permease subunit [Frondihabitans sucicola]BDZ48513.1 polysaccharide ABC transporter ATP-binding protein [Frondihabitans sucicola]
MNDVSVRARPARRTRAEAQDPAFSTPPAVRRKRTWRERAKRDRVLLLMAIPGLVLLLAFHYVPLLGNLIAFQEYLPFVPLGHSPWVGFDNFAVIFNGDPAFLNALRNTLEITLVQVVLVFPAPILMALLLNSLLSERLKQIVQSILYLPHFLSWVIVVAVFQQMLGGSGLLNNALRAGDHGTVNILGDPHNFIAVITSQVIWKDTGWATILFLAVLSQIDASLYEAASMDGASRWSQIWHVTLPGMRGIIILLLILRLGDSLSVGFEQIILQQGAFGRDASEVLDTYVYNNGVLGGQWGVAAAVGLVKGIVGVLLVFGANKVAHVFGEAGVYQKQ